MAPGTRGRALRGRLEVTGVDHVQLRYLDVGAIVPVSDLAASRAFYEGALGLDGEPAPGGYVLRAGGTTRIYLLDVASYAGQAGWPLASFETDDLAATVADLVSRGVQLEVMGDRDPYPDRRARNRRPRRHADRVVPRSRRAGAVRVSADRTGIEPAPRPRRRRTRPSLNRRAEPARAGAIDRANVRWNRPHKEYR